MRQTQIIMDMPVVVEIVDTVKPDVFEKIFNYFHWVDETFSTFKKTSEITRINSGGKIESKKMREIFKLAQKTKNETNGFFNMENNGKKDPSGIVKGWAIHNAAKLLTKNRIKKYYVEAGGDIEVAGTWKIGIRNPFNTRKIIKVITLTNQGIATSGTYERGTHIYNPKTNTPVIDIVSFTVIGPNVYEADRFATAAFAMGKSGLQFIEQRIKLEGYMIDTQGIATMTSGFHSYVV